MFYITLLALADSVLSALLCHYAPQHCYLLPDAGLCNAMALWPVLFSVFAIAVDLLEKRPHLSAFFSAPARITFGHRAVGLSWSSRARLAVDLMSAMVVKNSVSCFVRGRN
jgi:hypothetical protein